MPVELDQPLLTFGKDAWTARDAFEGTQVFGATGSGKTSGSGQALALAFLRAGFGGLVLTAKPDEVATWTDYLRRTNREHDRVLFDPEGGLQFNILDYEYNRPDETSQQGRGLTLNLVSLFITTLTTGESSSSADPYWNDALRELLTHAIDLAALGCGTVELPDLARIVRSAPQSVSEIQSRTWQRTSRCFELLQAAAGRAADLKQKQPGRWNDLEETVAYWLSDFPNLAERTRSVVVSSFSSKASGLLRDPLRRMLCEGTSKELLPAASHRGKVVILNLPVKDYGEVGRFAQVLYKTVWQRSTERRSLGEQSRPVFLWADESQHFITAEDMRFQQTARSKQAATVYLTQNLPNYYAALGSRNGNAATEALLGNLQTKVFHANGDPTTNEWASRVFGSERQLRTSNTQGVAEMQKSTSTATESLVNSAAFTTLRRGGRATPSSTAPEAEAIVFAGGRKWAGTSKTHLRVLFDQRTGSPRIPSDNGDLRAL